MTLQDMSAGQKGSSTHHLGWWFQIFSDIIYIYVFVFVQPLLMIKM